MLKGLDDYMGEMTAKQQVVGAWGFNARRDFSKVTPEETNVWFFEQVFNFLRSFFGTVLPDNMELITYNATKHIKKENLEQQTFLDELMLILKNLKEPLWTFRLNLNVIGFLRTHHDPDKLVRIQIQEPCSLIIWGGPDETGFQTFSITYTLFNSSQMEGTDEMIWSVNQPILEKALKKWEKQTGQALEVVEANSGRAPVFRHGFKRPATAQRVPVAAKRPGPGAPPPRGAPPPGARPAPPRPAQAQATPAKPATPQQKPAFMPPPLPKVPPKK